MLDGEHSMPCMKYMAFSEQFSETSKKQTQMADKISALNGKSQDTEEWFDLVFTRPLGQMWANFFARLGVHPNVVTILGIVLGVMAAFCYYFEDNYSMTILGIFLLVWANLYDSADGQLARMTGQKSALGRALDGASADVIFFAVYFFISLRLSPQLLPFGLDETLRSASPIPHVTDGTYGIWIWMLAAISGFGGHSRQCQLADYYRNVHLWFIKGESGSELDNSAALREEYGKMKWGDGFIMKLYMFFYVKYTHAQESRTPAFQRLKARLQQQFGPSSADIPESIRNEFRQGSLPLMKYTNILTFNCRSFALYFSLLLMMPWLYFVIEICLFTPICWQMQVRHERLCRRMYGEI